MESAELDHEQDETSPCTQGKKHDIDSVAASSPPAEKRTKSESSAPLRKARSVNITAPTPHRGPNLLVERAAYAAAAKRGRSPMRKPNVMLAETLIKDIPTTEYRVFLYNELDAADPGILPKKRKPIFTPGFQNRFFPKGTDEWENWNHYHVVLHGDKPVGKDETKDVTVKLGYGGPARDRGTLYNQLRRFDDVVVDLATPYKSTTCITLKFDLDHAFDFEVDYSMEQPARVAGLSRFTRPLFDKEYYDTFRLEVWQKDRLDDHVCLSLRFVEKQSLKASRPSCTQSRLFNIISVSLEDVDLEETEDGEIFNYTYRVKLEHPKAANS
ncbi:hypothetical protein FZEAL_3010 [Fusarium zealandicum]|uniref:Uncharacterized protein n=1 Tax=Fusarium zealandicum TaxID=1053134 RepID=A0A8H4UPP7_9HYPO|nr:hypothetical protein FZEAL_3010 [Fusarium zealandicum]